MVDSVGVSIDVLDSTESDRLVDKEGKQAEHGGTKTKVRKMLYTFLSECQPD